LRSIKIECDAEVVTSDHLFKTFIPGIYLENGDQQSNRYSRSDQYSVELSSARPYGFTFWLYNGKMGDVIKIEVWRFGKSGEIVMSGESGKALFLTSSKVVDRDAQGWDKLEYNYTLRANMKGKEIGNYLFNNSSDTSYFDDFSINIDKRK